MSSPSCSSPMYSTSSTSTPSSPFSRSSSPSPSVSSPPSVSTSTCSSPSPSSYGSPTSPYPPKPSPTRPLSPPPPQMQTRTQTFHLFPNLPPEIRLKIYSFALSHSAPRIVPLNCHPFQSKLLPTPSLLLSPSLPKSITPPPHQGCTSPALFPSLLHTTHETRLFASETYALTFSFPHYPPKIYFNYGSSSPSSRKGDILYFGEKDGYMGSFKHFVNAVSLMDREDLARVKRVGVCEAFFVNLRGVRVWNWNTNCWEDENYAFSENRCVGRSGYGNRDGEGDGDEGVKERGGEKEKAAGSGSASGTHLDNKDKSGDSKTKEGKIGAGCVEGIGGRRTIKHTPSLTATGLLQFWQYVMRKFPAVEEVFIFASPSHPSPSLSTISGKKTPLEKMFPYPSHCPPREGQFGIGNLDSDDDGESSRNKDRDGDEDKWLEERISWQVGLAVKYLEEKAEGRWRAPRWKVVVLGDGGIMDFNSEGT